MGRKKETYYIKADTVEEAQAEAMMQFALDHPEIDFESLQIVASEEVEDDG